MASERHPEHVFDIVFCLILLFLQSEDEEPDNDRQMEELQQDSNKKVSVMYSDDHWLLLMMKLVNYNV